MAAILSRGRLINPSSKYGHRTVTALLVCISYSSLALLGSIGVSLNVIWFPTIDRLLTHFQISGFRISQLTLLLEVFGTKLEFLES